MIGYILRLIRISNDMKIKEVAEKTGLSRTYIGEVEHCTKNPSLTSLNKFASAYNLTTSQILFFHEIQQAKNFTYQETLIMILDYYINQNYKYDNNVEIKPEKTKSLK